MSALSFRLFRTLSALLLLIVGCMLLYTSARAVVSGMLSAHWPKTRGVITCSRSCDAEGHRAGVRYQYTVRGREYAGERWRFLFPLNRETMRSRAVDVVQASYPAGRHVKVAVNPDDPAQSVLEPGASIEDLPWAITGLVLVIIALRTRRVSRK